MQNLLYPLPSALSLAQGSDSGRIDIKIIKPAIAETTNDIFCIQLMVSPSIKYTYKIKILACIVNYLMKLSVFN